MPVIGLSETRRLPRLGKIRLGIKVPNKKDPNKLRPKATEYLVCPPEVQELYGEQPTSLPIVLPTEELEANFPVYLKRYTATSGLACKGNGETADVVNMETGELITIPCGYKECIHYQKKDCTPVAILSFLLPEVPGFGVWQIATRSINSIINLQSEMALAKRICGRLAGLPFSLRLEPHETQVEGLKKTIYVLHLRSDLPIGQLRALPPFSAHEATTIPDSDEIPEDLHPGINDQPPVSESDHEEQVVNGGSKPLNANGDSALTEQRQVHIAGTNKGLSTPGFQEWLHGQFSTRHTRDLTKEQCMAAIAAVGKLTPEQVAGFNRVGKTRRAAAGQPALEVDDPFEDDDAAAR